MSIPGKNGLAAARAEELREDFSAVDSDGDGSINGAEFEALMEGLGAGMSLTDLRIGFREIDTDGDGRISCEEFIAWRIQ